MYKTKVSVRFQSIMPHTVTWLFDKSPTNILKSDRLEVSVQFKLKFVYKISVQDL